MWFKKRREAEAKWKDLDALLKEISLRLDTIAKMQSDSAPTRIVTTFLDTLEKQRRSALGDGVPIVERTGVRSRRAEQDQEPGKPRAKNARAQI